MQLLVELVQTYGLGLAFAAVLIEQIGLPIPSYPILLVTAALSAQGNFSLAQVVAVAVTACLFADFSWYWLGVRFGGRLLGLMCRISLSPDSCVQQSTTIYERWGAPALTVAKFVPGFGTVATAMAGIVRLGAFEFAVFDLIGALLWSGLAVALGWTFRTAIDDVLQVLESAGRFGLAMIATGLGLYVLVKLVQRTRSARAPKLPRISASELYAMIQEDRAPLLIDVRAQASRRLGVIPGSRWLDPTSPQEALRALPRAEEVVVYCACPNDAGAVTIARRLLQAGFPRARALQGGIDAWIASGLPLQPASMSSPPAIGTAPLHALA